MSKIFSFSGAITIYERIFRKWLKDFYVQIIQLKLCRISQDVILGVLLALTVTTKLEQRKESGIYTIDDVNHTSLKCM